MSAHQVALVQSRTRRKVIHGGINQHPCCDEFLMGLHSLLKLHIKKFEGEGMQSDPIST